MGASSSVPLEIADDVSKRREEFLKKVEGGSPPLTEEEERRVAPSNSSKRGKFIEGPSPSDKKPMGRIKCDNSRGG